MKAIFSSRPDTHYNDDITYRYQFPRNYLRVAERTIGDWIIFHQTQRGSGRAGYFSRARVENVVPDTENPRRYYAILSSYEQFYRVVPFRKPDDTYWENSLRDLSPDRVGVNIRGKSVRIISERDYTEIVFMGFAELLRRSNVDRLELHDALDPLYDPTKEPELQDATTRERIVQSLTSNRILRDAAFRGLVLDAYDDTCAITGLCIVNGQGKVETNAAHIRPVADNGPDVVRNGLALSATCHWAFDRHLLSLSDDGELILSKNLTRRFRSLLPVEGEKIYLPSDESLRPNPAFLAHHREIFESKWGSPVS
ncbi:MAG: HNH endonuclease [Gammaproteobacteria bacterium]|nr:HNH endonuclease [Gammaproteobacteria bacterium]